MDDADPNVKVCLVCTGNICRSPMAEAVVGHAAKKHGLHWEVSSRGTGAWHQGSNADPRALAVLRQNGLGLTGHKAQRFSDTDFNYFDVILAMDQENYLEITSRVKAKEHLSKVHLYLEFAGSKEPSKEVPDPYFGDKTDFEEVFNLLCSSADAVVAHIMESLEPRDRG